MTKLVMILRQVPWFPGFENTGEIAMQKEVPLAEFVQMLTDFANNPADKGWCSIRPETLIDAAARLVAAERELEALRGKLNGAKEADTEQYLAEVGRGIGALVPLTGSDD